MSSEQTCLVCGCSRDLDRERRAADLEAELRRQLRALIRQNDRLRAAAAGTGETGDPR